MGLGKMKNVKLGDNCTVEDGVVFKGRDGVIEFGFGCTICANAIVHPNVKVGNRVLIGDGACIREGVIIGDDSVIGRAVSVENNTSIGKRVRIQAHAYITAYCTIEDDVFIGPCVCTSNDNLMARTSRQFTQQNGCTIRKGARIGLGAIILPNIKIGENSFVAAGSVVTRNVPARRYTKGIPAKDYADVPKEEQI